MNLLYTAFFDPKNTISDGVLELTAHAGGRP